MLPELTQFEDTITLVSNTGIQFIDLGLTVQANKEPSGEFVKSTNETITRLAYNAEDDFYYYDKTAELISNNIVKSQPHYDVPLEQSLQLLNAQWLPLPFLRFTAPYTYAHGPSNWARMRIVKLDEPDIDGNNYRITIAFDTNLMPDNEYANYLAPSATDISSGLVFKLSMGVEQTNWFFTQEWVNNWLQAIFKEGSTRLDAQELEEALDLHEPQAHLLNILSLIAPSTVHKSTTQPKLKVPAVKLVSSVIGGSKATIPVDLVLDVGNSRTCGILIEKLDAGSSRLNSNYILQLRDLSSPERVYNDPFESRVEFAQAVFGKENFAVKSGRNDAFLWPTIARVGKEAGDLASRRRGTEGSTGLSSPKRYLWDENPYKYPWRFNSAYIQNDSEAQATAAPFSNLIDEHGKPLYKMEEDDRFPVFVPHYSRSSLMTFMLAEVLTQALCQMNSPAQRARQGQTDIPRQLNSITLTVPPGMAQAERSTLSDRLEEAIVLVWKSLGWHDGEENPLTAAMDNSAANPKPTVLLPKTSVEWDEASCGQLVYLFTEINEHFAGHPEQFFKAIARPDQQLNSPEEKITLATIDIGGGTTDLVITEYRLERGQSLGSNVHIAPKQLFRDSFKVAGDDIVLDVIRAFVLPSFELALAGAGATKEQSNALMSVLCGNNPVSTQNQIYRQQLTLQVFAPIALNILKQYEHYDLEEPTTALTFKFGDLMNELASNAVKSFVEIELRRHLGRTDIQLDIHQIDIQYDLRQLHGMFLSGKMTITESLSALCEVIDQYPCDMLLLTGRPSRLPGLQAFVRKMLPLHPGRILPMHNYHTGGWYPFHKNGLIDDPKTTAAVGAMLCMLAADYSIVNFFFHSLELKPYSTIRYFGVIDKGNHISHGDVLYDNIKTVDGKIQLPTVDGTEDGDPIQLEFRGDLRLGFRQLPVQRWTASPLYTLRFTDEGKAQYAKVASQSTEIPIVKISFKLAENNPIGKGPHAVHSDRLMIRSVDCTVNSNFNARRHFDLQLNTMLDTDMGETNYWLDSGNVK